MERSSLKSYRYFIYYRGENKPALGRGGEITPYAFRTTAKALVLASLSIIIRHASDNLRIRQRADGGVEGTRREISLPYNAPYSRSLRSECLLIMGFATQGQKIAKEYEKKGGDYENEAGTENKPTKGAPEPKSDEQKKDETKEASDNKPEEKEKEKPKANSGKKATGKKGESKAKAPKKEKKTPTEGTRKSTRIGGKRSAPEEEEEKTEEKAPAKKAKTAKTAKK
ncbi:MAG: hypothetical protein Q9170_001787 [Blastenia crenularia]